MDARLVLFQLVADLSVPGGAVTARSVTPDDPSARRGPLKMLSDDEYEQLLERVQIIRKARGITLAALATSCHVKVSTIESAFYQRTQPGLLTEIANVLGVPHMPSTNHATCKRGHPYGPRDSRGLLICRTCANSNKARYDARKRAKQAGQVQP